MWADVKSKKRGEDGYVAVEVLVSAKAIESCKDEWCDALGWRAGLGAGATYEQLQEHYGDGLNDLVSDWLMQRQSYPALETLGESVACDPLCVPLQPFTYGQDLLFEARTYVLPKGQLFSVEPVQLRECDLDVSEGDVDAQVVKLTERYVERVDIDEIRPVRMGDVVKVDTRITLGGNIVRAYSRDGVYLKMIPGSMPSQFLDGVVGMLPGELREFSFEAPGQRGRGDMMRYDARVIVTCLCELRPPHVDDAWVKRVFPNMFSVNDLREAVKRQMREQALSGAGLDAAVDAAIAQRLSADIPDALVEFAADCIERDTRGQLDDAGITMEQHLARQNMEEGDFRAECRKKAFDSLSQTIALDALFDQVGLQLSQDDVNQAYLAISPDGTLDSKVDYILDGKMRLVEDAARRSKAHQWLMETAVVL